VVTLPIMVFLGLDAATANATNRLPVLVGALSGALDFAKRKALPWRLAFRIALPTTIGSLIGAFIAEIVPRQDMGMVMTAAVLLAMLLLFKNIKKAIEQAQQQDVHLGLRELALFFGAPTPCARPRWCRSRWSRCWSSPRTATSTGYGAAS
jgi:uncharacterized membrane protein YfcA